MTPVVNVYMIKVDIRESVLCEVINSSRIQAIQTHLLRVQLGGTAQLVGVPSNGTHGLYSDTPHFPVWHFGARIA